MLLLFIVAMQLSFPCAFFVLFSLRIQNGGAGFVYVCVCVIFTSCL